MIRVKQAEIELTELELDQLVQAVAEAKKETTELLTDPMPDFDMSIADFRLAQRERGIIRVGSGQERLTFIIDTSNNCESRRFRLLN